ncbi:pyridoxamine 5'-phosphate oxidase [Actinoplanes octamycinicus]|uniref:Pyridoxamine 5'-phosphate oxidase n=1 Tax=Actinoplanes octamycinicus TaxID=135948 RepID=A0A7W7H7G3_9ACTN|nr:pyridoxal 5'-phosphate synthase [Actinoplanes octamycinicus]MBB4745376.1 pyridoxamine 5'-phosphate oxidase [Actinoplanes octamycinicus]GIE56216.1 pyridoxamine 5'-phosphate oxidase [Actinoplanes octamycinicus]
MSIRDLLRGVPVFARPLPGFAAGEAPDDPHELFASWLADAVTAGVLEPHAMTLSTVDADGLPDTRILLLREVDAQGWQFATDSGSAKGRQLARHPAAALGFYWREQGRQIRVRGKVLPLDREASARDFRARTTASRAASLASKQSEVLADPADLEHALAAAERAVQADPDTIDPGHTVYSLVPASIEFWQGDAGRRHVRLRYRRSADAWQRELLWP